MSEKKQTKKYARVTFKSGSLQHVLNKLKAHYKAEHQPESLVVPYVLTCAAWLESQLNESLHQFLLRRYDEDVQHALLSLQLPKKLNIIVPVLTEGRYRIKKDHFVYQRLASLIHVRNSITHAKPQREEIEAPDEDLVSVSVMFPDAPKLPRQFFTGPDITLGASKQFSPLEYHDALDKFKKYFLWRCPDKLSKIAMVIDRSKEAQWKAEHRTYGKML